MRRVPRQQLQPDFVVAIRDDIRSLAKLAMAADFAAPCQLIDILNATSVLASTLNVDRFGKLALIVGYRVPLFVAPQ
jgi:hypothetical protein